MMEVNWHCRPPGRILNRVNQLLKRAYRKPFEVPEIT